MNGHSIIEEENVTSTRPTRRPAERRTRKTTKTTRGTTTLDPMRMEAERAAATFPFHNDKGE